MKKMGGVAGVCPGVSLLSMVQFDWARLEHGFGPAHCPCWLGTLTTQTYIQALFSAKDSQTARMGALTAAMITLPSGIPAVMVGMFMRVHHPDIAPIDALPLFMLTYLPAWLGGMSIAALLLASVGSAAGLALGVGTMVTRDFLPQMRWRFGERHMLAANRLTVMVIMFERILVYFWQFAFPCSRMELFIHGVTGRRDIFAIQPGCFLPGTIGKRFCCLGNGSGHGDGFHLEIH